MMILQRRSTVLVMLGDIVFLNSRWPGIPQEIYHWLVAQTVVRLIVNMFQSMQTKNL